MGSFGWKYWRETEVCNGKDQCYTVAAVAGTFMEDPQTM